MILADRDIKDLIHFDGPLIIPFSVEKIGNPSYGLSSHGYDIRLGKSFIKLGGGNFTPGKPAVHHKVEVEENGNYWLKPGGFILGCSHEKIKLPPNITGLVKDKSSYARLGICVQNTVLEAGWEGVITLEISNHGPSGVHLLVGEGIAQILFFRSESGCDNPYSGKYQGDTTVVPSK